MFIKSYVKPHSNKRSLKNSDVPVLYRENWPKSTAVITEVIVKV